MDKWNDITKQIKLFIDEYPDAPFDIRIINRPLEAWKYNCFKCFNDQKWDVKVIMKVYLQPEGEDEVDGIRLEHKKTFTLQHNDQKPTC